MPAPLVAPPAVATMPANRVTVKVGATTIVRRLNVEWAFGMSQVGHGSFALMADDAQVGVPGIGDTVTFELDGNSFLRWTIDMVEAVGANAENEAGEVVTFSGPSQEGVLDDAIVYEEKGITTIPSGPLAGLDVSTQPFGDDRYFGPPNPGYDHVSWPSAVGIAATTGTNRPQGMPDSSTQWIWTSALSAGAHAAGTSWFHGTFDVIGSVVFGVRVFHASRDILDALWIDGVLIDSPDVTEQQDSATTARAATIAATDYVTHHIVAKVTHDNSTDPAGFACVVFEKNSTQVLVRTNSSWDAITDGALPTFTFGYVVNQLIDESQARGELAGLSTTFGDVNDSGGDPFGAIIGDFTVKVGDTLLSVLEQAAEFGVEWRIDGRDADLTLSMWVADGAGAAVAAEYERGVNVARMVRSVKA